MRIAEVSKKYDISADTLRYYERIGLLEHVRRNESGIRDYSEADCARIQFIKCMRGANVSIEALIEYMQLFAEGDSTVAARKALLEEQRDRHMCRVPLEDVAGKLKYVDPESDLVREAKALGISFGDE